LLLGGTYTIYNGGFCCGCYACMHVCVYACMRVCVYAKEYITRLSRSGPDYE